MTLEEARDWQERRGGSEELRTLYPTIKTDRDRHEAWTRDNSEKLKESMGIYFAAHPFLFPNGATVEPSGSLFSSSQTYSGSFNLYWDNQAIVHDHKGHDHKGLRYIISSPEKVAALHAFRDRDAATAYIFANADSLVPWRPRSITVPETWFPGVWPMARNPWEAALHDGLPLNVVRENYDALPDELHDPVRFPLMSDVRKAAAAQGKDKQIRYTLSEWRTLEGFNTIQDWCARQHYYAEHFDLKEVLDAQGRIVSSERGVCHEARISRL
ncbi:hypothetical protein C8R46DRAFT_359183 [Mycena filopes]|nr:hypothetical protein C8R46DRAFT_359183 [Mycena filopes]